MWPTERHLWIRHKFVKLVGACVSLDVNTEKDNMSWAGGSDYTFSDVLDGQTPQPITRHKLASTGPFNFNMGRQNERQVDGSDCSHTDKLDRLTPLPVNQTKGSQL